LLDHFLLRSQKKIGRVARLGPGVREWLLSYDYPGNVRELENLIEQGVALAADGIIRLEDVEVRKEVPMAPAGHSLADAAADAERRAILTAIEQTHSLAEAAETLGISTTTLWRKMKRLKISRLSEIR
jgi:two-component system, NtrC family, response regulator HydG